MGGKVLGKKALLLGAIGQSIPDVDFIPQMWLGTSDDLLAHRGFTHSILFGVIMTLVLSVISWKIFPNRPISRVRWLFLFSVNIFSHVFIDTFNAFQYFVMEENKIPAADEIIRQKIAELLFKDPTIDSGRIQVEVTNGEALLKGHIDTEVEKQRSEELARSLEGVKNVINHLHIDVGLAHALSSLAAHIQGDIIKDDDDDANKP